MIHLIKQGLRATLYIFFGFICKLKMQLHVEFETYLSSQSLEV